MNYVTLKRWSWESLPKVETKSSNGMPHLISKHKMGQHLTKFSPTLRGSPGQDSELGQATEKLVSLKSRFAGKHLDPLFFLSTLLYLWIILLLTSLLTKYWGNHCIFFGR